MTCRSRDWGIRYTRDTLAGTLARGAGPDSPTNQSAEMMYAPVFELSPERRRYAVNEVFPRWTSEIIVRRLEIRRRRRNVSLLMIRLSEMQARSAHLV